MKNLFISFSGGETSAFMTIWCLRNLADRYDSIAVVFANTGQENEETLEFVDKCSRHFGFPVAWVEAVVHHGERKACSHKIVDFSSASRDGQPFENVIRKYGIPNQSYPHCTRELKLSPMNSYIASLGWTKGGYDIAIGIRVDEIDRMSPSAEDGGIIYPLINRDMCPATKHMINAWWDKQPFRLRLKGYEGNCKWCWKKSLRKHLTLITERPEIYDFPEKMEAKYGLSGHNVDGTHRLFFRNHTSTADLRALAEEVEFAPAEDDAIVYPDSDLFGGELDLSGACSESCEVDFEEQTA